MTRKTKAVTRRASRSSIGLNPLIFGSGMFTMILASGCSVTTGPGSLTLKSKTRYVHDDVTQTATAAWAGQTITIENDGVNPSVNGGVTVIADGTVSTITATARPIAYADADDKASADLSIADAIATFTVTQDASTTTIHCGHGGDHGSSSAAQTGCELLTVHIPLGSTAQPLGLVVGSGNGDVNVTGPVVGSAQIITKETGDTALAITPTVGANISVNGVDAVTVSLPSDFAANTITLSSADSPPAIDTTAFPDVKSGSGRGTAGSGALAITLTSSGILDTDVVKLALQ